jgi:hypothetical protein
VKKLLKWLGIIVVALVVINMAVGGDEETQPASSDNNIKATETVSKPEPAKEEPKEEPKEEEKESVTKENYEKIKQGDSLSGKGGMTFEEVVAILGEPDDKMESETEISGQKYKTLSCSWRTLDFESISVTFTNNGVSHKIWMD